MKIIEKQINCVTGEETIIERDETAQEQSAREATIAEMETLKADAQAKATARQTVLDRLGITAEEAQLLLGGN